MPLPVTFATLTQGNEPAALLDTQFAALGALVHIPCTAVGQNAVTLTPAANTPTVAAYTDLSPAFLWVQPQTTTGAVTIALSGLSFLNGYRNNGQTAIGSGDLVAGSAYQAYRVASLNSGAGGWVVDAFVTGCGGAGTGALKTVTVYSGSQTITIPASVSQANVKMWGATGASGNCGAGQHSGGTGAGGYLEKLLTGLTPANTLIYTQGGAGAGGAGAGGNGGTTTLASGTQTISTLTCNGSVGTASGIGIGGVGATATGGDINITGQSGQGSTNSNDNSPGGRNFYSIGADGATNANGNNGNPGGLIIEWYT